MTDTAVSISQSNIQVLEQSYTFRGRTDILQYLDNYPFLLPVLLEAPEKIRLEISSDPVRKTVTEKLARLRGFRNQADYVDKFPGLSGITLTALTLSEEVISILNTL
jgi:hypothetical protein